MDRRDDHDLETESGVDLIHSTEVCAEGHSPA